MNINGLKFDISYDESKVNINKTYRIDDSGIEYITIDINNDKEIIFPELTIKLFIPAIDIHYKWNPKIHLNKSLNLDWFNNLNTCNAFTGAPVECLMSNSNENRFTVALSDTLNTIKFQSVISEETAEFEYSINLFENCDTKTKSYSLDIRIDRRKIPYFSSLSDVSLWWESLENNTPAYVPPLAKEAMYSSWYSFHQILDEQELINQCKLSKDLGLKSIIIDDGWQTDNNNRGYAYCGDWQSSSKIKEMRTFTDNVHKEGMNILVWYSVPFIGKYSKAFKRFNDMIIDPKNNRDWYVLDPRYKKVRDYIINIYETALIDWDLDGFKLDFVDEFVVTPFSGKEDDNRRDYSSITEASDRLLKDCISRLKNIKPNIMLEFRQTYNGPMMRTYGNIFRAVDCPLDDLENRVRITDIRLISGNSAVHSDMIMWNYKDTVESASLQLINVLFSVPQISMLIDKIPKKHYKMLKFYLNLWNEYRDAFINGDFIPLNPNCRFNVIKGIFKDTFVCSYHSSEIIDIDTIYKNMVFVNGTSSNCLHIMNKDTPIKKNLTIYNCTGDILFNDLVDIKIGYNNFSLPPSSVAEFK